MKRLSALLIFTLAGCNSDSSEFTIDHTPFQSTSISSSNNDILKVVEATRGFDYVGVGEATHEGSKAFSYKARIVKALHQEGNLDFVGFEAGLYDGLAAWRNYVTGQQRLIEAITGPDANYMYGHRLSLEVQGLMDYINDEVNPANPLILVGYDARINSDPGCSTMFDELETYINSKSLLVPNYARIKTLAPVMMCPWYYPNDKYTLAKHNELVDLLTPLISALENQKPLETVPTYDPTTSRDFKLYASFWLQIARSLKAHAYFQINGLADTYTNEQSAENLKWLREEWFNIQGQTLIWAHNIHATPTGESVIEAINRRYPDESTYSIMQLTYTGNVAISTPDSSRWAIDTKPYEADAGTLNHQLYNLGLPDSFIDLHSLTGSQRSVVDIPKTIKYDFSDLEIIVPSSVMDGILFIPEEKPAVARPLTP